MTETERTTLSTMSVSTGTDSYDSAFLDALGKRVLIGDGAMGTMLQASDLTLDDFQGLEGCNEILNVTRPEVLADRKSTRLNSSHSGESRMPSSA